MTRRVLTLASLAVAGMASVGAFVWWRAAPVPGRLLGVVLITLDTTRADRLSLYGSMDVSLPALERVAREGVVFENATAPAPLTLPSHTTILTGLLPLTHNVRDNADTPLADSHTTMAELLKSNGFRTGAFVGSVVLDADRGLSQGFDHYSGVTLKDGAGPGAMQRPGDAVVDEALQWLDTVGGSPFLLWTHLYDPHRPYEPPEPFYTKYGHEPYVGEIAYADSQIGRLLDALERKGLLNKVTVIIAGDHGESLGDHGERDHGIFVYQEVMRVPLLIRSPGIGPSRVGAVVRLTDIVPTVTELLDLPQPKVDGASLLALMRGREPNSDREAYGESLYPERLGWSPLYSLRERRFKLIDAPQPELYDLDRDPFEMDNVFNERPDVAQAMTKRLRELVEGSAASNAPSATVAPELQERLAALGYAAAPVTRNAPDRGSRPDPKDCIGTYQRRSDDGAVNALCGPMAAPHR
jgi:choline-sulfatase